MSIFAHSTQSIKPSAASLTSMICPENRLSSEMFLPHSKNMIMKMKHGKIILDDERNQMKLKQIMMWSPGMNSNVRLPDVRTGAEYGS